MMQIWSVFYSFLLDYWDSDSIVYAFRNKSDANITILQEVLKFIVLNIWNPHICTRNMPIMEIIQFRSSLLWHSYLWRNNTVYYKDDLGSYYERYFKHETITASNIKYYQATITIFRSYYTLTHQAVFDSTQYYQG